MLSLARKNILITGASSGIGAACAKHFAQQGSNLLLCSRKIDALNLLAREISSEYGVEVYAFALDISDHEKIKQTFASLPTQWKTVDILINNAGAALGLETLQEADLNDLEVMINTNIKGLIYMTKEVLPVMLARNMGHIINIGSIAGHQVYPKATVYCATKYAVKALTEGLRMDVLGSDIRISAIDPGAVKTNFSVVRFKGDKAKAEAVYEGMTPLIADDIAETIVFCATRPPHVNISEIIIMPTDQASATIVSKKHFQKDKPMVDEN